MQKKPTLSNGSGGSIFAVTIYTFTGTTQKYVLQRHGSPPSVHVPVPVNGHLCMATACACARAVPVPVPVPVPVALPVPVPVPVALPVPVLVLVPVLMPVLVLEPVHASQTKFFFPSGASFIAIMSYPIPGHGRNGQSGMT